MRVEKLQELLLGMDPGNRKSGIWGLRNSRSFCWDEKGPREGE